MKFGRLNLVIAAGAVTVLSACATHQAGSPQAAGSAQTTADPAQEAAAIFAAPPVHTGISPAPAEATSPPPAITETAPAAVAAAETPISPAPGASPPPAVEAAAPAAEQIAAKVLPLPPQDVMNTIEQLRKNPRLTWQSGTSEYIYYVGGLLNAAYEPYKKMLRITTDPRAGNTRTCFYSGDGNFVTGAKKQDADQASCDKLVNELAGYLK